MKIIINKDLESVNQGLGIFVSYSNKKPTSLKTC